MINEITICDFDRQALIRQIEENGNNDTDQFVSNSRGVYKPVIGEDLLKRLLPAVREAVGEVYPSHSYARVYENGAVLNEHTDRDELDFVLTIPLKRDASWSISVMVDGEWQEYEDNDTSKGTLYEAKKLVHARPKPYKGKKCYQLFLHYTRNPSCAGDKKSAAVVQPLLNKNQVRKILSANHVFSPSTIVGKNDSFVLDEKQRDSDVCWLLDRTKWDWLYRMCGEYMNQIGRQSWNQEIDELETMQLTRYSRGQFFNWHNDNSDELTSRRKLSATLLLQNAEKGGGIELRGNGILKMNVGDCAIFKSEVEHQAVKVQEGIRYALIFWGLRNK